MYVRITRIPRNIPIRLRRIRDWKKNSFPFLSGDLFADYADVSLYESRFRRKAPTFNEIANAESIFCPSHKYEEMLSEYGSAITARVLILGNSDRDFTEPLKNLPPSIVRVFRQNSTYFDDLYRFLPIGIENLKLGQNGQRKLFEDSFIGVQKENKVLVGPFSPTHEERNFHLSLNEDPDAPYHLLRGRISPKNYARVSSQFAYVASPRGNGLDTHRFWEALYRGSYPIVLKSSWSSAIESLGIPIIQINNWSTAELQNIVNLDLPIFDPVAIKQLWAEYWYQEIESVL